MTQPSWMRVLPPALATVLLSTVAAASDRPNVLLLLVDDLKPALGCYGDPHAITPNLDALAARGMRFDLAYANQAVCAPSRFNLMLGSQSSSSGLYGLGSELRELCPEAVTLPQHFARHGGYRTESLGKVFHVGHGNEGDPVSFTVPPFKDKVVEYLDPASTGGGRLTREEALFGNLRLGEIRSLPRGMAWESPEAGDEAYADGRVAAEATRRLREAKARREAEGTPFFLAVGFARPHLPFCVPKRYWDLHDPATLPMPQTERPPVGAPEVAGKRGGEIAAYEPVPEGAEGAEGADFPEELKRRLVHGYYASASYVDVQIGKVLASLDELGLDGSTIVALWGDHGFHLGDHGYWTKHTNYEEATRIPLLLVAPGATVAGTSTRWPVSTVDLFPTLAELAGLPAPTGPQPIDGASLVPLLRDLPDDATNLAMSGHPGHALHVFPRGRVLGRAIRTDRHRLVEWKEPGADPATAELELYDYESDPGETRNLAENLPERVAALRAILAAYPEAQPTVGSRGVRAKGPGGAAPLP
jgi:iduronate 2-sulfatase